ncbi:metal-dependent hydrolase [Halocatena pleomorpha]|uniref:Metal-dependent hydrolase n=1 Tax=Halocatena pleomorpha TaxID=1785090 RepID=A0A3P3R7V7_9EURY|nr:metal-dependent hydrolase [Halocatena pleomorpha]RRJ29551.1 metal-dependent hydrolase [Halocatena pleomorpha]
MYKRGHFGIGLLVLAPIHYVLLPERPMLALLVSGILVIQGLPDKDQGISWLEHRGTSHSLFSAVLSGAVCAGVGWAVGEYFLSPTATWLSTVATSTGTPAAWWGTQLTMYDAPTMAVIGFAVGAGGIVTHLLGDIITPMGLQPFRPFSERQYNVASIPAANQYANSGFFVLGLLAMLVALTSVYSVP